MRIPLRVNKVTVTHATVAIATSSTALIAAGGAPSYIIVQNDTAVPFYMKVGGVATTHAGILVPANGSYEFSAAKGNMPSAAVTAIATAGSCSALVTSC